MKFKYTGPLDEITLRDVTFPKGKPVEVLNENFQQKLGNLDYFTEVKRGRRKNDKNSG